MRLNFAASDRLQRVPSVLRKLEMVALLITDPPPTYSTTLSEFYLYMGKTKVLENSEFRFFALSLVLEGYFFFKACIGLAQGLKLSYIKFK